MPEPLNPPRYALVAYVQNSLGRFVEAMRRELHPDHTHLAAHITVLPPRTLNGNEAEAVRSVKVSLSNVPPFQVTLGDVETFFPTTPTVFIRVERFAHKIRDLHEQLNSGPLYFPEQWPYMPHLTIVKMPELEQTDFALQKSRELWSKYQGARIAEISELAFVREGENNQWIDLAKIPLGISKKP